MRLSGLGAMSRDADETPLASVQVDYLRIRNAALSGPG